MPVLSNSTRAITKATHTSIELADDAPGTLGRAHDKAALLRALQLRSGEVDRVRPTLPDLPDEVMEVVRGFEPQPVDALTPPPSRLAGIDAELLAAVGQAVLDYRVAQLGEPAAAAPDAVGKSLVTMAAAALDTFANAVKVSPIGMLHLERIEMTPVGIERGELLATIPLAPGEETSVVQKEWTVTNDEFSEIVTDSLENYSEKGVTEKTELAEATESQTRHSQQLGLDASVSGSYGFVTFSTSAKFSTSLDTSESRKASRTHAAEVTGKASSRVRKERKVTIQTSTEHGQEETSTRKLVNPSKTDTMRIDYYSMMRKWRVRLLQYGLRLTYDIAIPEPGATLRAQLADLADLDVQITRPFAFPLKASDITPLNYEEKAEEFGASVPPPPVAELRERVGGAVPGLGDIEDDSNWHFYTLEINVPAGYQIRTVWLDAMIGNVSMEDYMRHFAVFGYGEPEGLGVVGKAAFVEDMTAKRGFLAARTGRQQIVYFLQRVDSAAVTFDLVYEPVDQTEAAWRFQVWQACHDAARDAHYAGIQALAAKREELRERIEGVDTLTLRQEERQEVMKGVLRWLLGPAFEFMPDDVFNLLKNDPDAVHGLLFTGSELGLDATGWATMFRYQEMVKFVQQAIEWENLLYFCYPYFWDVPVAWDFVRTLRHPDAIRQQFLRAGTARVVLTIRPGYEADFAAFVDNGNFGDVLPPEHPYLTIAQEIRAHDQTNYPGIPPANPEVAPRPLLTPLQRRAWQDIQQIVGLLERYRTANGAYPTTAQGLAVLRPLGPVPANDPWGTPYVYVSPGRANDYELASLGADRRPGGDGDEADVTSWAPASLIAEWYEYTPSHGTDIALNTAPPNMA